MTGRHRPLPVITAGEPQGGAWCPVCLQPWRLVIPLYADGREAVRLEVCPGCGTGHDRSSATITSVPPAARVPVLPRLAGVLHARLCARKGLSSPGCAWEPCQWPGLWRHMARFDADDGATSYLFCRPSHRGQWLARNS